MIGISYSFGTMRARNTQPQAFGAPQVHASGSTTTAEIAAVTKHEGFTRNVGRLIKSLAFAVVALQYLYLFAESLGIY